MQGTVSYGCMNSLPTPGIPKLPDLDEIGRAAINELDRVAGIFKLSQLQTICTNILTEQEFLNPSIGTFLNDQTGANMKKMFFNQPEIADVKFLVEGEFCIHYTNIYYVSIRWHLLF